MIKEKGKDTRTRRLPAMRAALSFACRQTENAENKIKPKMKSNYRVVSTFDSESYPNGMTSTRGVYGQKPMKIEMLINEYPIDGKSGPPAPNAPIRAKDTLLAQLLKAGIDPSDPYLPVRYNPRQAIGIVRRNRNANLPAINKPSAIKHERLVGKLIGVEIEFYPNNDILGDCESYDCDDCRNNRSNGKRTVNQLTSIVTDGSLEEGGMEIRRLTWADKDGRLKGLLNLSVDGHVNSTCGLHVHVDARHLGENGLRTPEETYDRVCEFYQFIKRLVPKSRRTNDYCEFKNNRAGSGDYSQPPKGDRYAAVNWLSFKEHGTLEFRCQGGSTNLVKIESWALLCRFIVEIAARSGFVPSTWIGFLATLPEPLLSWCILRDQKLNGIIPQMNERTMSAISNA